ncbi:MAG: methyltransferase domain-containing protein [Planctomycetota bacterium]|jgi:predicted methyltransferase
MPVPDGPRHELLLTAPVARALLAAPAPSDVDVSLDLGLSTATVRREEDRVRLPDGQTLDVADLDDVAEDETTVYLAEAGRPVKASLFSETTDRHYKLHATDSWPALIISGVTMHRIGPCDPKQDAESKIRRLGVVRGRVLDTCCGLGYTAIVAAATAREVTTVELDDNVLELARINPHSRPLFEHPRITLVRGDVAEVIESLGDGAFDVVVHDPPTLRLAGDLYADEFYGQLLRVLRRGGRLLHYTGAPGSRRRGVDLPARVARRLRDVGFGRVRPAPGELSVVATKPARPHRGARPPARP